MPDDLREGLGQLDRRIPDLYGERCRGLVPFGFYARGEARGVDLLEGEVRSSWQEYLEVEPIKWFLSLESGYVLPVFPVNLEAYLKPRKPFLMNARRGGVPVP